MKVVLHNYYFFLFGGNDILSYPLHPLGMRPDSVCPASSLFNLPEVSLPFRCGSAEPGVLRLKNSNKIEGCPSQLLFFSFSGAMIYCPTPCTPWGCENQSSLLKWPGEIFSKVIFIYSSISIPSSSAFCLEYFSTVSIRSVPPVTSKILFNSSRDS